MHTVYYAFIYSMLSCMYCTVETLGLSMELNDNILVQTTSPQTIARVKRVKCFMLQKVAQKMRFAWYVRFHCHEQKQ